MKSILAALVLVSTLPAHAQQSKTPALSCWSFNTGVAYRVLIGQKRTMKNPFGPVEAVSESYPVQIIEAKSGETVASFDGSGDVTDANAHLVLLIGGDMAMGTLDLEYEAGRYQGTVKADYYGEDFNLKMTCVK